MPGLRGSPSGTAGDESRVEGHAVGARQLERRPAAARSDGSVAGRAGVRHLVVLQRDDRGTDLVPAGPPAITAGVFVLGHLERTGEELLEGLQVAEADL